MFTQKDNTEVLSAIAQIMEVDPSILSDFSESVSENSIIITSSTPTINVIDAFLFSKNIVAEKDSGKLVVNF